MSTKRVLHDLRTSMEAGIAAVVVSALIAGCGGGGASGGANSSTSSTQQTVTGVAAAGSPIEGTVTAKDSAGRTFGPVTIAFTGAYTINVSGGTAPFILEATGVVGGTKSVTLHSVAEQNSMGGNVNITPLTEAVIVNANATGTTPSALFSGCISAATCSIPSASGLGTAETNIQAELATLFQQFQVSVANLLTTPFTAGAVANQSPVDVMMDVVSLVPKTGAPGAFDIVANIPISGVGAGSVVGTLSAPTFTASGVPAVVSAATSVSTTASGVQSVTSTAGSTNPLLGVWRGQIYDGSWWDRTIVAYRNMTWVNTTVATTGTMGRSCTVSGTYSFTSTTFTGTVTSSVPVGAGVTCTPVGTVITVPLATAISGSGVGSTLTLPVPPGAISATPLTKVLDSTSTTSTLPSFDGTYTSTSVLGGWTHTERDVVVGNTVTGFHTFTQAGYVDGATGLPYSSFAWTGTLTRSSTNPSSASVTGSVTISNNGTRTASLQTGNVQINANGSADLSWTATDPTFGPIGWTTHRP